MGVNLAGDGTTDFLTGCCCELDSRCPNIARSSGKTASCGCGWTNDCRFFPASHERRIAEGRRSNEALADFQLYAHQVREPLKMAGIEFHELYTRSFRVRVGKAVTTFRATKDDVGYYLVVPGKKPHIEYGVMTDADLLKVSKEYFEAPAE